MSNQPQIIISPTRLQSVIQKSSTITNTIKTLHKNIEVGELPESCTLIGIAQNVMLGIFNIEFIENEGYYCSRIMVDPDDKLIIGTTKFPITNMEHVDATIDCNIDYLVGRDTIARIEI